VSYSKISVDIEDRIATITLTDPERHNAMSLLMREECMSALHDLEISGDADCIILTGDGSKAFSAGADINELKERTITSELSSQANLRRDFPRFLETMRLPTLACINGHCLGAGLEIALACTLRIAATSARLGLPEINLGVIPGSGGTQRLARVVGLGRAMEMVTLGEPISAQSAFTIGLVNAVHDDSDLTEAGREICRKWQAKGAVSLMAARDAVLTSPDIDISAGIEIERKLFALCLASGERDEGVKAFLEKRKPKFRRN
tara:strand:- start:942 stop:1727 length:786 start_codon:yes stop_codon:yes gene_type:complete